MKALSSTHWAVTTFCLLYHAASWKRILNKWIFSAVKQKIKMLWISIRMKQVGSERRDLSIKMTLHHWPHRQTDAYTNWLINRHNYLYWSIRIEMKHTYHRNLSVSDSALFQHVNIVQMYNTVLSVCWLQVSLCVSQWRHEVNWNSSSWVQMEHLTLTETERGNKETC